MTKQSQKKYDLWYSDTAVIPGNLLPQSPMNDLRRGKLFNFVYQARLGRRRFDIFTLTGTTSSGSTTYTPNHRLLIHRGTRTDPFHSPKSPPENPTYRRNQVRQLAMSLMPQSLPASGLPCGSQRPKESLHGPGGIRCRVGFAGSQG